MLKLQLKHYVSIIGTTVYLCLLGQGLFFVYHGGVLQRYLQKYTNFAVHEVHVDELPTILTYMEYSDPSQRGSLEYGSHFNISFQTLGSTNTPNFTKGVNSVHGSTLKVQFDVQSEFSNGLVNRGAEKRQHFKITPLNFSPAIMDLKYQLVYSFGEFSDHERILYRVAVDFIAQNNSWCGEGYHDGEEKDIFVPMTGEKIDVILKPEKYIFHRDVEVCRDMPYNEILFNSIFEKIFDKCDKPCRHPDYWLCGYMEKVKHLPICSTKLQEKCFTELKSDIAKSILEKPCTKLQYKYDTTIWRNFNKNEVKLDIRFPSPPKVSSKEEYLIYDLISMIGAIGGTLGLCIGFSFWELFGFILKCAEVAMRDKDPFNKITTVKTNNQPTAMA